MEGVQFLLKNPVYVTEYSWSHLLMGLAFIIMASIFVAISIKKKDIFIVICCLLVATGNMFLSISSFLRVPETKVCSHAEYVVTISDDVKLKEFMELYEIVDVDGDLYTIVIKSELKEIA
jgi:hypothetical protein